MIITEKIQVKVNGYMVKYYNQLGLNVKQYDIIDIPIYLLNKNSHHYIVCSCDICGEKKEISYKNYNKYIEKDSNNLYTCKKCNSEKRKKTCLEKYGVDNISKLESNKEKVKDSMNKNGTTYGFKSQSYKETLMKNYGVENPSQSIEIKKKKITTCLNNHGVEIPAQSSKIYEKMKESLFKNYGVRNPSHSFEIHKKQHSGFVLKHHQSGLYYRGTYEKDFIDFCLEQNIKIENFNGSIDYIFEGKKRKYFPDFYIRELNMVIEIKSLYTYQIEKEQNEAKKEATISSGFDFAFVIDKNYNF